MPFFLCAPCYYLRFEFIYCYCKQRESGFVSKKMLFVCSCVKDHFIYFYFHWEWHLDRFFLTKSRPGLCFLDGRVSHPMPPSSPHFIKISHLFSLMYVLVGFWSFAKMFAEVQRKRESFMRFTRFLTGDSLWKDRDAIQQSIFLIWVKTDIKCYNEKYK